MSGLVSKPLPSATVADDRCADRALNVILVRRAPPAHRYAVVELREQLRVSVIERTQQSQATKRCDSAPVVCLAAAVLKPPSLLSGLATYARRAVCRYFARCDLSASGAIFPPLPPRRLNVSPPSPRRLRCRHCLIHPAEDPAGVDVKAERVTRKPAALIAVG
jgi:hypothetical protein